MADRVDAVSHRVQAPGCESMVDGVFPQAQVEQLPPRNHPMLSLRQPSDSRVGT